ncbi:MAG: hypothetical protein QNJ85_18390 [Gammaproteobacteria bacterium]|nr:hypothetical protein [Gammaproteobacteria bacterium]
MNKVCKILERYFETVSRARVNAVMMTLDRDPWALTLVPTNRHVGLLPTQNASERSANMQLDRTQSGHGPAAADPVELQPAQHAAAVAASTETHRSAA